MRRLNNPACLILIGLVAGMLLLKAETALKLTGEARAQLAPGAAKLVFDQGIGFYVLSGGKMTWLEYPTLDRRKAGEDALQLARGEFRMFIYGIDLANNPLGLPPHLAGFQVLFNQPPFNIDSPVFRERSMADQAGPYPVRFVPLPGYGQPVYEIKCDLWEGLRKPSSPPAVWGLKVKEASGNEPEWIYWFVFRSEGQ